MPGRAEGMERHVAVDCAAVDPQAKADMSQHLYNKKMQTLERKGVKRRAEGEGAASAEPSAPMLEQTSMAPQIMSHMPPYSGAAHLSTVSAMSPLETVCMTEHCLAHAHAFWCQIQPALQILHEIEKQHHSSCPPPSFKQSPGVTALHVYHMVCPRGSVGI